MQFIHNALSTNALLQKMVIDGEQNGRPVQNFFALYTDYQTDGRGMGSNRWFSDADKNILASFHFQPSIPVSQQFLFNQYFSIVTAQFLERFLPVVEIKWPNDIYVDGKKIAGILIEHSVRGEHINHTIAGIGLNVNQDTFPEQIPHPTSLWMETGKRYDPVQLLREYRDLLVEEFKILQGQHFDTLREQYRQRLYRRYGYHPYRIQGADIQARIVDTDPYGRLILEEDNGTQHVCAFKEVVFLRNDEPQH